MNRTKHALTSGWDGDVVYMISTVFTVAEQGPKNSSKDSTACKIFGAVQERTE